MTAESLIIKVKNLDQADAALQAAEDLKKHVILENCKGTHRDAGFLYMKEVMSQAVKKHPGVNVKTVFDAGDSIIVALAAINCGFEKVRFSGHPEWIEKLKDIASQKAVDLILGESKSLDLGDSNDAYVKCKEYLEA